MGDVIVLLMVVGFGVYMVLFGLLNTVLAPPEKIGSQLHTLAQELEEGFGMKLERYDSNAFVYSGEVAGRGATLTLKLGQEMGRWGVLQVELKVSMDLPSVVVRFAGRGTNKVRRGSVPSPEDEMLGLSPAPVVVGRTVVAQMLLNPELCAYLMQEPFGSTGEVWAPRWREVTFDGDVTFVHVVGFARAPDEHAADHAVRGWEEMLAWAGGVVGRCPERVDVPEASYLGALDEGDDVSRRARAARVLLTKYADGPQAAALRDEVAGQGGWLEAMCALGQGGATFDVCREVLEVEGALGVKLARELGEVWPWETFAEVRCPTEVRAELMEEALGQAPEDPSDGFVGLLVSEWRGDANRREMYMRFKKWGWEPDAGAREALARGAIASIRRELLKELAGREATPEDVPMLIALKERGHEGDVAPYLAALGGGAAGKLTLSDEVVGGGLTALGERGALSPLDEE